MAILELSRVTMRFGGLVAVNALDLDDRAIAALRPDRPQRRRQDDGLQRHHRRLHADLRRHRLRGDVDRRPALRADHAPRDRAHFPEHPALLRDVGAREREGRLRLPSGDDPDERDSPDAEAPRRGGAGRRGKPGVAQDLQARSPGGGAGQEPAVRQPAPPRDRTGDGDGPAAAAAGRARGWNEPAGIQRAHGSHPLGPGPVRDGGPPRRAQHEGRHGHLRDAFTCSTTAPPSRSARRPRSSATRRSSRPTWEERERDPRGPGPVGLVRRDPGPERRVPDARARRDRHAHRRERGGKDDDPARDHGPRSGGRRRGALPGPADPLEGNPQPRPRGARARSRGADRLREPERARKSRDGGVLAARRRHRVRLRKGLRALPEVEGAAPPDRRHALGRRTADACHRARHHVEAARSCCSTSRRSASRRSSSMRSSRPSRRSTRKARRSCWSSRTPTPPCAIRAAPTSSRRGTSPSRARRRKSPPTRR